MTNEPKLAPEAPAKDAANEHGKKTEAKPIETTAPATAPTVDAKKV
jgi:hypothetical protein